MTEPLAARVVLAISAYRSDDAVLGLLAQVCTGPSVAPFVAVLVLDSLGSGAIPAAILARGWTGVRYRSAAANLGSAGNLAERLRWAAELEADFVYALNHDGSLDVVALRALVSEAVRTPKIGAAYPLRRRLGRDGRYDLTGRRAFPLRHEGSSTVPPGSSFPVRWGSSNGTLYALAPVRAGVVPMAELWMGWEDLAYGWALTRAGYAQICVTGARFDDPYEYAARRVGPVRATLTDKPSWYAYYFSRNLILAARRQRPPLRVRAALVARIAAEVGVTVVARPQKRVRLRLLAQGVWDGLRGRSGKGSVP